MLVGMKPATAPMIAKNLTAVFIWVSSRKNLNLPQAALTVRIPRICSAHLLLKAAQPVGGFGKRGGQNLDGDFAVEACVTRAVDLAHPARAELGGDTIV